MLKRKFILIFSIIIAIVTGLRCFLVSVFVDPQTGFYSAASIWPTIFNASVLVICVLGVGFILFSSMSNNQTVTIEFSRKWQIIFALNSILLGASFIYDFLRHRGQVIGFLPSGIGNVLFQIFPGPNMGAIRQSLGLISGIVFITQGMIFLINRSSILTTHVMKLAQILPVLWAIMEVMQVASAYTTICYISDNMLGILALMFIMRTMYSQATLLAFKTNTREFIKTHVVAGVLAVFFSCLVVTPFYIFPAFESFHSGEFYYGTLNRFILLAGLYIAVFLVGFSLKQEREPVESAQCGQESER